MGKKKRNFNYQKGRRFEYACLYFLLYHGFDNLRSYGSKGVLDLKATPPRKAKLKISLGIQCKDTTQFDYLEPKEREGLKKYNEKFSYLIVLFFKKDHEAFVKLTPWELKGKILRPEVFLKTYYGIDADDWKIWRKNWYVNNVKRKPLNNPFTK